MGSNFVPLSTLTQEQFLSVVNTHNTNEDGSIKDPNLLRRMDNDICKGCHARYREKYPGEPFRVKCSGIYGEQDYEEMRQEFQKENPGEDISVEEIREIYDVEYWANKYIVLKDDSGTYQPFSTEGRDYQKEMLRCTATHKVDRLGRGLGKALSIDTPIPTPSGWRKMIDLEMGDKVFDDSGKPCHVTFSTGVMYDHKCYDVIFSDGQIITADADHLWETWDKRARVAEARKSKNPDLGPKIRTTEEISLTLKINSKLETNHSIKVCGPLQYSRSKQEIDPYILGLWLGDGGKASSVISTAKRSRNAITGGYQANGSLFCQLRDLGVVRNKHIPSNYLFASVDQRIALLQGLMDSDGSCRIDGWAEFDNTNELLARQVFQLITELGMKPCWSEKDAKTHGRFISKSYRIGFQPTIQVFRLTRKSSRIKPVRRPTVYHRYIVNVVARESVPVKCIQVDSPKSLYLAGKHCIATHNTSLGVIEELHKATTNRNYEILVVCPAQSQSLKWYGEIKAQTDNSPYLDDCVIGSNKQPFYSFRFANGSCINIFTAGSKSGRGADSVRSQNPRRVRLDEQDYLADKDYQAIMPLARRHINSEFHGSSTPTGLRGVYWQMCMRLPEYREFYFPITVKPGWNPEMEAQLMAEAKTMDRYRHEFLAEFGDPEQGLFKGLFIDQAKKPYRYGDYTWNPTHSYMMGVDWNGKGTGTKIRVVGYDPATQKRTVVATKSIDAPGSTMLHSRIAIRDMNREWRCEDIFIDFGFSGMQDEEIRRIGEQSDNPIDRRLIDITVIDFGGTLEFNKLVSRRDPRKVKYLPEDEDKVERHTKPFMVDGVVQALEAGLFDFSAVDQTLEEQMRAYRVKTYSNHGYPASFEAGDEGDHDLDAVMLAMLAIEMKYGLIKPEDHSHRMVQLVHSAGFGLPSLSRSDEELVSSPMDARRLRSGVPSRSQVSQEDREKFRIQYMTRWGGVVSSNKYSAIVSPSPDKGLGGSGRGVPSRTSVFKKNPNKRLF